MNTIPISPIAAQTFNVVLDGQYCTISLYWRQNRLYLDLNVGSDVICVGRICQNKVDIIQIPVRGFNGSLHFWDSEGDRPPYWQQLNSRYFLLFAQEGEDIPSVLEF